MNRFHGRRSLQYVYHRGKTARGQLLATKAATNAHRKVFRCAVVVSKKVSKSAVTRNRIRRRIYAVIRSLSDQIHMPVDIVVIVYDEQVATIPSPKLVTLLQAQLKQVGAFDTGRQPSGHAIINAKES